MRIFKTSSSSTNLLSRKSALIIDFIIGFIIGFIIDFLLKSDMPRKSHKNPNFGKRLSALRKAAGITQVQLASLIGSSQRAIFRLINSLFSAIKIPRSHSSL